MTEDVTAEFVRNPPEYVVSDDLGWLDEIVMRVTGTAVDMKELVATRLVRDYRAFRAAHGTRTDDVGQFYKRGLRILRAGEVEDRARAIFLGGALGGATEERLAAAIDDIGARRPEGGREGVLYFCADERSLVTRTGGCGHYLVYGSEYLFCLGMRVVDRWEAKRVLKSIGRPTVLICDIPMTLMRERLIREFGGMMVERAFCEQLPDQESHSGSPWAGTALSIPDDLPSDCIVGHYHPAIVHDPLH
ncbi:hypothetical protein [Novosphingopyxis baekryungensis]|uniref:hypothetical protein n=1 Tax=Novosphingopyxis baekryungensis TaxID=279369 RepID=UPI000428CF60|nr:hypothetical protein [Novosphingopyxis baekryungensis]